MDIYYDQDEIVVRSSVPSDIDTLSKTMRKEDVAEIWSSHHHQPKEALEISYKSSGLSLTVENKGEIVAMFGYCPESLLGPKATIWMLSSEGLDKIKRRFIKNSRLFIDFMLSHYNYLYNFVSVNNTKSLEWLRFCGAKFSPPMRYGAEGEVFQYFWFEKG